MIKVSKVKIRAYILLFFVAALLLVFFYIDNFAHKNIPEIYEIKATNVDNGFVSFNQIDKLNFTSACAYKEIDANIKMNSQSILGVKTVLTNENYYDLYKLNMVAGTFFDKKAMDAKQQYAVISDKLALKLYLRKNPIGETIYIDDYSYTIMGVYEDDDTLWGSLNKDNYDRLYIPLSSYPGYMELTADAVGFTNDDILFENIDTLIAHYPQYISNFSHYNYIEKLAFSTQPVPILLFTLQMILIIFILRMIYNISKLIIKKTYDNKGIGYFSDIIKIHLKELVFLVLFGLMGGVGIWFLGKSMIFPIVIPVSVIPNDNLFDINHYISKIIQALNDENTIDMVGNNYFYLLSKGTFLGKLVLLTYIYPTIIVLFNSIKNLYFLDFASFVEILSYCILISLVLILLLFFVLEAISLLAVYVIIFLITFLLSLVINKVVIFFLNKEKVK